MKLKLTYDETQVLFIEMRDFSFWTDASPYEISITRTILKVLMVKLMKKLMDKPKVIKIELDEATILALNFALNRMMPEHEYNQVIIWEINSKLNQHLVNIS